MPDTPWVGLAALIAMFVIPFLPNWLFEGPRTVKHWPRRHICGGCNRPWSDRHMCSSTGIRHRDLSAPAGGAWSAGAGYRPRTLARDRELATPIALTQSWERTYLAAPQRSLKADGR